MIESNICKPKTLAIRGGSNGGLLVANMYVMRPDLFGAIHCAVPLLDMQRYHKLLAGASWMAEYGNPDTDDWEKFLQKYSPYHNIQPGAKYPPILVTTSTRDDRVHPGHARYVALPLFDRFLLSLKQPKHNSHKHNSRFIVLIASLSRSCGIPMLNMCIITKTLRADMGELQMPNSRPL